MSEDEDGDEGGGNGNGNGNGPNPDPVAAEAEADAAEGITTDEVLNKLIASSPQELAMFEAMDAARRREDAEYATQTLGLPHALPMVMAPEEVPPLVLDPGFAARDAEATALRLRAAVRADAGGARGAAMTDADANLAAALMQQSGPRVRRPVSHFAETASAEDLADALGAITTPRARAER